MPCSYTQQRDCRGEGGVGEPCFPERAPLSPTPPSPPRFWEPGPSQPWPPWEPGRRPSAQFSREVRCPVMLRVTEPPREELGVGSGRGLEEGLQQGHCALLSGRLCPAPCSPQTGQLRQAGSSASPAAGRGRGPARALAPGVTLTPDGSKE